ncbi:MAG: L-2-hydroxyglutarate oxidase [Solirubrobacterales bacterium]|nr:L-2-hydroxyglutarate oxidase [Solirubrobacterales bacterium]
MQPPTDPNPDFAVVGGGIVGLAVARELLARRPGATLTVLERDDAIGRHQTGHNSGVIHAGIYYAPGSLKARLCVAGARAMYEYCDAEGIRYERAGKLIVARDAGEVARLDELERRGAANGVPGLRRLDRDGLREVEPHCEGVAALHSPQTGVVDFGEVARSLAAGLERDGAAVRTGAGVEAIAAAPGGRLALRHAGGETRPRFAVFCAGAWSDRLATLAGAPADPRIVPFRGAYLRLRPGRAALVRSLIYPVPDPSLPFLGVHLSRHVDGEVSLGPTALLSPARAPGGGVGARRRLGDLAATAAWPGSWRMARRWWRTGLGELADALDRRRLARAASSYVPGIEAADLEPWFAGIRAQAVGRDGGLVDDFVIHDTERAVHVRNAPSPAATSSLAIAKLIADRVDERLR